MIPINIRKNSLIQIEGHCFSRHDLNSECPNAETKSSRRVAIIAKQNLTALVAESSSSTRDYRAKPIMA